MNSLFLNNLAYGQKDSMKIVPNGMKILTLSNALRILCHFKISFVELWDIKMLIFNLYIFKCSWSSVQILKDTGIC